MKIICAWCLTLIRETSESERLESHGICERCATETFSELTRDALSEMEAPKTLADIEAGDLSDPDDDDDRERKNCRHCGMRDCEGECYREALDVGRDDDVFPTNIDRAWRNEIAREEGMLGGIESFNDHGGSFYE